MNPFGSILAFAAGLLVLWLICKLLAFPLKVLWKLVVNALLGAVILFLFNFVGGFFSLSIPINALNALITGVLVVPGVILLLVLQWIL